MNDIKLSLCIPTFNREQLLREAIDSFSSQLSEEDKKIV
jgi:glycosyltransferase involved in cell wall biosynthesis